MIRLGKISYWHVHAWDYTNQALEHPGTEIAAVWDEVPERGQAAADKLGVPFYANLEEMLAQGDIDGVIVDAPTNRHHEVMVAAARAGKHIFTEKVVAPTVREVNDILAEVEKAGVKLTVSLPRVNEGYTLAIMDLLKRQAVGKVTLVRCRLAHNGATAGWLPEHFYSLEQCAGGALIDLGCHPMYLTRLFLGELPEQVSAHYGYVSGKEVEDNAVAVLTGSEGAMGIVEAGFVTPHSPFSIEIYGTEGSILFTIPDNKLLIRSNKEQVGGKEDWEEVALPASRASAFHQWVEHIEQGTDAKENVQLAKELTMLMEAANLSASGRRPIALANLEQ
ncbi:Gfo/Idh/MocA family oxidoreductase [Paenibacillus sp. J5C_2022]|uniref:Gfo/Idh/MocA family protein n=1 Tax=Paenibacillus sp. J5C2022 TaxID=2977129 RepID=UPI0021D24BBB|nr:Gfo/Idh/MocA family oxidoreductase [Paenibacillus sp. J5C2022]MCU6710366.1 Gfo/Idh/MocA family oxidoreductase [Paenibacillus sp. J5C2022]